MSTNDLLRGASLQSLKTTGFWRAPIRFLFGYDIFISYARGDAAAYAELLETKLEALGFATFRDKREINAGDQLGSSLRNAIRRSRQFVLLDTPAARQSLWVADEVNIYLNSKRQRLTRVICQGVGRRIEQNGWADKELGKRLDDFVWTEDTPEAFASGRPSDEVTEQISKNFRTVRLRNLMRMVVATVIAILSGLLTWSITQTMTARHQARIATVRELVSLSLVNERSDPELSVLLAMHAVAAIWRAGDTLLPELEGQLHRALLASHVRLTMRENGGVQAVGWSPDGNRLATGTDGGNLKIWDASSGKEVRTLSGHAFPITSVAWSPDGERLATGSEDQTVKLWDAAGGHEPETLSGSKVRVNAVAWSPDGKYLAAGSWYGTVKAWDAGTGQEWRALTVGQGYISSVAWNVDGRQLALGSGGGEVSVWDIVSRKELTPLEGHVGSVWGAAWSPDGKLLATASRDGTARVWDAQHGKELMTVRGHRNYLTSVAWSPDGTRLATGSRDQTAKVWDVETGNELLTLSGHSGYVMSVAWSPDGKRLATVSLDRTIREWDTDPGYELPPLIGHSYSVIRVKWSEDGKRLLTDGKWEAASRVWDAMTGKELSSLEGEGGLAMHGDPSLSSDGKMRAVVESDAHVVKVLDATGKQSLTLRIADVTGLGWSPDSTILATGTWDGATVLWDAKTGKQLRALSRHSALIRAYAWSPNGKRLATASADNTSKVWDVASGAELVTLNNHTGEVFGVAWSPDGKRLATASADRTVQIYAMDIHDLMALARQRVTRDLTQEECRIYFRRDTCPPLSDVAN